MYNKTKLKNISHTSNPFLLFILSLLVSKENVYENYCRQQNTLHTKSHWENRRWSGIYSRKRLHSELVRDADALIIRTRTHCNCELLEGSQVKFIATATIGFDHIDTEYCRKAGITWTNAPGCNSASVAQYIESALALLKLVKEKNFKMYRHRGVGNVGGKIIDALLKARYASVAKRSSQRRKGREHELLFTGANCPGMRCDNFHVPLYKDGNTRLSIWPMKFSVIKA